MALTAAAAGTEKIDWLPEWIVNDVTMAKLCQYNCQCLSTFPLAIGTVDECVPSHTSQQARHKNEHQVGSSFRMSLLFAR